MPSSSSRAWRSFLIELEEEHETPLPRHDSEEEQLSSGYLPKLPKPARQSRLKNDTASRNQRSKHQERELARSYVKSGFEKAQRIAGSGSFGSVVADVDPGEWFLAEAKETRSGKLTVDPKWVSKIAHQAKKLGRPWWCLHAWVGEETGPYSKLVILEESHFYDLVRRLNELA